MAASRARPETVEGKTFIGIILNGSRTARPIRHFIA
jgi:hypothetical protein